MRRCAPRGTRTNWSACVSASSAAAWSPAATAGNRRSLTAASCLWSAVLAVLAIRLIVASCSAATAFAPPSDSATPCSHSALYRGLPVATYSAWAAICCCVPRSCWLAPATAWSQRVASRHAWPAEAEKPSATAMATTKIAVTAPKPRPSVRPTVHLKFLIRMTGVPLGCLPTRLRRRAVAHSSGARACVLTRVDTGWTFGLARLTSSRRPTRDGRPYGRPSGAAYGGCAGLEAELPHEALELLGGAGELLGRRGDLLRRGARLLRGGRDLLRGRRRLLGDRGDLGHVGLDLVRAGRDLLDRGGDLLDAAVHVLHRRAQRQERLARLLDGRDAVLGATGAVLDDLDGLGGLGLDLADEPGDRAGRRLALLGQLADLLGDDREAAALLAGARRLDGRVQRQQVRLLGDAGDRGDDALDLLRLRAELTDGLGRLHRALAHGAHGLRGLGDRARAALGDLAGGDRRGGRLLRVAGAHGARRRDLLGGDLRLLDGPDLALGALGALAAGGGDLADGATGLLGRGRHLLRRGRDTAGRRRDLADQG